MEALIAVSVAGLQKEDYTEEQRAAALGVIFGVDNQLVRDGTYLLAEVDGTLVGCGAWSQRNNRFGSDHVPGKDDGRLDPSKDAARIRGFFIHPAWSRKGIGSAVLRECEARALAAGFSRTELTATLTGVALYLAHGYTIDSQEEIPLQGGVMLPVTPMSKNLSD